MEWVGLDNYAAIFRDASFLRALTNTLVFAAALVFIGCPLALAMAVLIHQGRIGAAGPSCCRCSSRPTSSRPSRWRSSGATCSRLAAARSTSCSRRGRPAHPTVARIAAHRAVVAGAADDLAVPGLLHHDPHRGPDPDAARVLRGGRRSMGPASVRGYVSDHRPAPAAVRSTFATPSASSTASGVFDAVNVLTKGGPSDSTNVVTLHAVPHGVRLRRGRSGGGHDDGAARRGRWSRSAAVLLVSRDMTTDA